MRRFWMELMRVKSYTWYHEEKETPIYIIINSRLALEARS